MDFQWPCYLSDCVSRQWIADDVCFQLWESCEKDYVPISLTYAAFVQHYISLSAILQKHLRLPDNKMCSMGIFAIVWKPHILAGVVIQSVVKAGAVFYPVRVDSMQDILTFESQIAGIICLYSLEDLPNIPEGFHNYKDESAIFAISNWCLLLRPSNMNHNSYIPVSPCTRLAYIISSSGTSGKSKKLVFVADSCLTANIVDLSRRFESDCNNAAVLVTAPLTFDPCLVQIYFGLATRRRVVLTSSSLLWRPGSLRWLCLLSGIDWLQCTPTLFLLQSLRDQRKILSLPYLNVVFGGEPFPLHLFRNLQPKASVYGIYGVTEVSCWSTIYRFNPDSREDGTVCCACDPPSRNCSPIGFPMLGTNIQLKKTSAQPTFTLELTRNYGGFAVMANIPTRVSHSFYYQLTEQLTSSHYWLTGDEVFVGSCTRCLWYCGRMDRVVKRMGHRVCLDRLESCILRCHIPEVSLRFCHCFMTNSPAGPILVATVRIYSCIKRNSAFIYWNPSHNWLRSRVVLHIKHNFYPDYIPWLPDLFKFFRVSPAVTAHGKLALSLNIRNACVPSKLRLSKLWRQFFGGDSHTVFPENTFHTNGGSSLSVIHFTHTLFSEFPFLSPIRDRILSAIFTKNFGSFLNVVTRASPRTFTKNSIRRHQSSNCNAILASAKHVSPVVKQFRLGNSITTDLLPTNSFRFSSKWKFSMRKCVDASALIMSGTTPHDPPIVFIGAHSGIFAAINLLTGEQLWCCEDEFADDRIEAAASLAEFNSTLLTTVGTLKGFLHGIDITTGVQLWKYSTEGAIKSPSTYLPEFGLLVIGSHSRRVDAIDLRAPTVSVWSHKCDNSPIVSSVSRFYPLSDSPYNLYATTLGGSIDCIDIRNPKQSSWLHKGLAPIFSTATCHNSVEGDRHLTVCTVTGNLVTLDAHTGNLVSDLQLASTMGHCNFFKDAVVDSSKHHLLIPSSSGSVFIVDLHSGSILTEMDCQRRMREDAPRQINTPSLIKTPDTDSTFALISRADGNLFLCELPVTPCSQSLPIFPLTRTELNFHTFSAPVVYYENHHDISVVLGGRDDNVHCLRLACDE